MSFDPITALLKTGETIVDKIWPDADEADKRKLELARLAQQGDLAQLQAHITSLTGQLEINKTEATHKSVFVAGWRPAIGWVCAVGLGWNFIVQPLFNWFVFAFGGDVANAPSLDISELITILGGMLGLSAVRMNEKIKGVASNSIK